MKSKQLLLNHIAQSLLIHGNALVAKVHGPDSESPPTMLWPLDWSMMSAYGQPGGAIRTSGIERDKDGTRIRGRTLHHVVVLEAVLEAAEDAGMLLPVDPMGQVVDASE